MCTFKRYNRAVIEKVNLGIITSVQLCLHQCTSICPSSWGNSQKARCAEKEKKSGSADWIYFLRLGKAKNTKRQPRKTDCILTTIYPEQLSPYRARREPTSSAPSWKAHP